MPLRLHDGEPPAGPWRVESLAGLLSRLLPDAPSPPRRARMLAVDGRSASGKTTLAERIAATSSLAATVVHTDDIAWNQAVMDWAFLLAGGVLEPLHRGEAVSYRPPAWDPRGRPGAIDVPASCELLVVEGVGSGRAELAHLYDAIVWLQSDAVSSKSRGIARDELRGDHDILAFWDMWQSEEAPFFAQDRPWSRADAIVAGTPVLRYDERTEVVVAAPVR